MNKIIKAIHIKAVKTIHELSLLLAITVSVFLSCASEQKQPTKLESQFVEVTAFGASLDDADTEAKLQIVERGIGVLVEGGSAVADGQLQYSVVSTFTQGYVSDYRIR
jgi:riboflavin biosynthesis pyrimidine reductase